MVFKFDIDVVKMTTFINKVIDVVYDSTDVVFTYKEREILGVKIMNKLLSFNDSLLEKINDEDFNRVGLKQHVDIVLYNKPKGRECGVYFAISLYYDVNKGFILKGEIVTLLLPHLFILWFRKPIPSNSFLMNEEIVINAD